MDINIAYFKVSDKEVLRSMVALYGFEAVQSALFEVCRPTPRALDACPSTADGLHSWRKDSNGKYCFACGKRQ